MERRDIIVLGASAGGVQAVRVLAQSLPAEFPASLFVVIHSSPFSPFLLPQILNRDGPLLAVQTQDRMPIQPGRIYVAPPDHHLLLRGTHIHVVRGPRENLVRPAVDPLFRTAAHAFGRRVIGVVLTGNLNDGSAGLVAIKERGGLAIVQDPDDARFPSMPQSALRYVKADHLVKLGDLGPLLVRLTREELLVRPADSPGSPQLTMESALSGLERLDKVGRMESIGSLAPYSCPDCHGPVWRIQGDGPLRFRCHVGHGFTAESLEAGQSASTETNLWEILRTLEERASLLREMVERAKVENRLQEAGAWESLSTGIEDDLRTIQRLLTNGNKSETPDSKVS